MLSISPTIYSSHTAIFPTFSLNMEKSELPDINLELDEHVGRKLYENHCLIGKILSDRPLDQTLVKSFTQREWNCKSGLTVSNIRHNMFVFFFQDKEELSYVLKNRPWTVMGGLLILSHCASDKVPNDLSFSYSAFWVQAHGLPMNYFTLQNGSKIGALLGVFVSADYQISYRRFLRLRVVVDVRKPILTGFWLERCGLPNVWVDFKYEKLGVFCYRCGRIGKNFWSCNFPAGNGKFGPWLRADSWDHDCAADDQATLRLVDTLADRNDVTTLIAVKKAKTAVVDESLNLDISANMEFDQPHEAESISTRILLQRFIINSIDSTIMLMNCAIIYSRMTSEDESECNWTLFFTMSAYVFHLFRKLIRFLKAQDGNGKALVEILVLIMFLVMLVSF
ncbi:UNVERIFIED_CONTAM: hypothetical protein Sradi_0268100 [Sesamum radiatum]|uniref:DUF4283 domain-containing protein n=1 Tax=Sesamum radiatum TaxID=300843 RepID=A0AAW2W5Z3_SESRA